MGIGRSAGDREHAIRNVCRLYTVNRFDALPGAIRTAMLALLDESRTHYLTTGAAGVRASFHDKIVKFHGVSASGWTEKPARWHVSNRRARPSKRVRRFS